MKHPHRRNPRRVPSPPSPKSEYSRAFPLTREPKTMYSASGKRRRKISSTSARCFFRQTASPLRQRRFHSGGQFFRVRRKLPQFGVNPPRLVFVVDMDRAVAVFRDARTSAQRRRFAAAPASPAARLHPPKPSCFPRIPEKLRQKAPQRFPAQLVGQLKALDGGVRACAR